MLCLAVMLSVMVVGAGAAFSDQDKIENTEAVDACSALNIINGYEDGAFHPERNIKRAEVTKMICVALNGGEEPNTSTNAKPTFTDVRGTIYAWAEGYIESCYAQGIVDGVNGNRFAPASNVTAAQLAKMLLVSLGYNAKTEQFTGNAWETNVNVRAAQKHLYDGLEKMDTSAPVTRDQAAQMVWNAMQAYEVEYKDGVVQDKVVGSTNDKITLLRDRYDAWVYVGTLTNVDGKNITISMTASDRDASDPKPDSAITSKSFSKVGADYTNLMGQKVKVLFKDGKTNEVIGVYATGDNTVYNTRLNQTERDGDKIKFDGKSYNVDNANKIKTIIDGANAVEKSLDYFDDTAANKVSMNTVAFVDTDENGKIDTAVVTTYTGAEVTYVGADKITAGGKSYDKDDENIDDTLEKNDYAVISENLYDGCKDIVKAKVITGELTSYKEKDGYVQYQLDGAWYNMKEEDTDVTTGDNVKAYVFNGVVLDLDTDSGTGSFPGNIVVVTGVAAEDDSLNGDQIKVRYFDGSTKTVTLADDVNFKPVVGVAYKASGSDSAFKVEKLEAKKYNGYEAAIYGVTNDTSLTADKKLDADPNNDKIGGLKVSDDAAIILFDGEGRSKQITGKQFNAMVNSDANLGENGVDHVYASFTKESNGLTRVMMASVLVNSTSITGQSSDNYGYIVTEGARTPSGDTKYTIWTGSENVTVTEDTSYARGDRAKGTLIGYSSITDGTINDVTKYGTVKSAKSVTKDMSLNTTDLYRAGNEAKSATTYIAVNGNQFNVTADTTVLLVDSKADDDSKIGLKYTYKDKLPQAEELKKNEWSVNAFWLMDEAGTDDVDIEVLVIDSTGVFDGMKDTTTGGGEQGGETGTDETLPNNTEKQINVSGKVKDARYVDGNLYVQFNDVAFAGASEISGELKITDGDGASVWKTFTALDMVEGTHKSKVLKIPYTTSAGGALSVTTTSSPTIDSWFVSYVDGAGKTLSKDVIGGATKTVTNKVGEKITVTVKLPTGATEFQPEVTLTNVTKTAPSGSLDGSSAYTADVAFEGTLTAGGQPVIKVENVVATKYAASIVVKNVSNTPNGVGYASVPTITELAKNAVDPGVDMTVTLTDAPTDGDKLVVSYTVNGVEKTLTHNISDTNTAQTIDFNGKIDAVAGKTDIVITKIERYGVLTLPTDRNVSGSGTSNAATYDSYVLTINGEDIKGTSGTLDVLYGAKVVVKTAATAAPDTGTDTITVTAGGMGGTKTADIAAGASGDSLKVEITLTMQKSVDDFSVEVANA